MANMRERALFALLKRPERIRYRNNNCFQVQEEDLSILETVEDLTYGRDKTNVEE